VPVKNWDLPTLAGAGAIRSTVNDMLKFVAANLGRNDSPLSAVMEKDPRPQHSAGLPDTEVAHAWHVRKKFGSEIIWHNGRDGWLQLVRRLRQTEAPGRCGFVQRGRRH
jgi:CubicO group peptidase (beta-lactamase class C family)